MNTTMNISDLTILSLLKQDENGNNRPVCSFVKPLRAGRLLDTAREAARFVSLIHQERTPSLGGGGRTEQWTTMHAFLARNKGVRIPFYQKKSFCLQTFNFIHL